MFANMKTPALSVEAAADALAAGQLVAFPTETVYGLGADACSDAAVAQIFAAKGRPADHPLIVHVAQTADAQHFVAQTPDFAEKLMAAFWPGPLTLILLRKAGMAAASAGGQASIGLRCPSHPMAQALLRACAARGVQGLAAPSANTFGRISPTTAAHVASEFAAWRHADGSPLQVLDGGPCSVGIESTIIDCTRGQPVLLRPGMLNAAQISSACGLPVLSPKELDSQSPKASGTLEAHYAPRAKLRLMDAAALQAALDVLGKDAPHLAIYARAVLATPAAQVLRRRMPDDAAACAQQLFAVLRGFDDLGVKLIWVESLPPDPAWDGVRDRLQRAAAS